MPASRRARMCCEMVTPAGRNARCAWPTETWWAWATRLRAEIFVGEVTLDPPQHAIQELLRRLAAPGAAHRPDQCQQRILALLGGLGRGHRKLPVRLREKPRERGRERVPGREHAPGQPLQRRRRDAEHSGVHADDRVLGGVGEAQGHVAVLRVDDDAARCGADPPVGGRDHRLSRDQRADEVVARAPAMRRGRHMHGGVERDAASAQHAGRPRGERPGERRGAARGHHDAVGRGRSALGIAVSRHDGAGILFGHVHVLTVPPRDDPDASDDRTGTSPGGFAGVTRP